MTHRPSVVRPALLACLGAVGVAMPAAAGDADGASQRLDRAWGLRLDPVSMGLLDAPAPIKIGVQVQARYDLNGRDDDSTALASPDDDLTTGFSIRRAKVEMSAAVTDTVSAQMVIAFDRSTGEAGLENAFASWDLSDAVELRVGQFKLPFLREELVSSKRQLMAERSSMNETFNQDFSQGVQLGYAADAWRASAAFSDGFGSRNTAFNEADEADYALTARAELRFGDASWAQFDQFTSFRGAAQGGMLGVAGHFESRGDTNPADEDDGDVSSLTADLSWLGDGWNASGAVVYRHSDDGADSFSDYGAVVQGGLFVSDQTELFARWSAVFADSGRGATGEDYSDLTLGLNRYLVPESHAAKFTLGVTYSFDATAESIVQTSTGHNLLSDSEDGQIGVTAQLQVLF